MILPQKRPARTVDSMVWSGTRAGDLQTSTIFRWNATQSQHFADFLRIHGENSRTTADLDPLLIQLNLDGYKDVITNEGKSAEKIILDKVKTKLRNVQKIMPANVSKDKTIFQGIESLEHGLSDDATVKLEKQFDSFLLNQPPIAVNPAFVPQFTFTHGVTKHVPTNNVKKEVEHQHSPTQANIPFYEFFPTRQSVVPESPKSGAHGIGAAKMDTRNTQQPVTPAQGRPVAKAKKSSVLPDRSSKETTATPPAQVPLSSKPALAHPFIKMPKGFSPQISDRTETTASPVEMEPAPVISDKQANRKHKAERIHEAWHAFQAALLEVDQEPDEEEDEELYEVMAQLLYMNRKTLYNKGVLPLVRLAELEDD